MIMIRLVQKSADKKERKYWTDEITETPSGLKFLVKTKTGKDLDVFLNYGEIAEMVRTERQEDLPEQLDTEQK